MGLWDNRVKQFNAALNLPEDQIARKFLRATGAVAGGLGDVLAIPVEAALDVTGATPYLAKGVQAAMEHDIGKRLIKLAKENPVIAKDIGAIVNIIGIIPAAKIVQGVGASGLKAALKSIEQGQGVKTAAVSGARAGVTALPLVGTAVKNMPTLVRGGLFGDAKDLGKYLQSQIAPKTLKGKEKLTVRKPLDIARGLDKKLGSGLPFYNTGKIGEYKSLGGELISATPSAMLQSLNPYDIARQRTIGRSRYSVKEREKLIKDIENKKGTGRSGLLGSDAMQFQIALADRAGGLPKGISPDSGFLKATYVTTPFNIVDDVAMKSSVYKHVPDDIAKYQMNHVRNIWNLDPNIKTNVLVKRPEANAVGKEFAGASSTSHAMLQNFANGKMLKSYKKLHNTKDISDTGMVEITQIALALNKSNVSKFKKSLKNIKIKSDQLTYIEIFDEVLNARRKRHSGIELTDNESIYLNNWEKLKKPYGTVKDSNNNIISNSDISKITIPDDRIIHGTSSFLSSQKELGGVNFIASTNLKTMKTYVGGSDASDLQGAIAKGATQLVVMVPPSVIKHNKKGLMKVDFKANKSIPKKDRDKLLNNRKRESKVFTTEKITPSFEDYSQVIKNIGLTGSLGVQTDTNSPVFKGLFSP